MFLEVMQSKIWNCVTLLGFWKLVDQPRPSSLDIRVSGLYLFVVDQAHVCHYHQYQRRNFTHSTASYLDHMTTIEFQRCSLVIVLIVYIYTHYSNPKGWEIRCTWWLYFSFLRLHTYRCSTAWRVQWNEKIFVRRRLFFFMATKTVHKNTVCESGRGKTDP